MVREVLRRLDPEAVGQEVELAVLRGGERHSVKLKIGERPGA